MDASSFNLHLPLMGCRMSRGQGKLQEEKSRAIEAEAALREGPSGGCGAGIDGWIWRGQKSPPAKKDDMLFLEYFFVEIFEIH